MAKKENKLSRWLYSRPLVKTWIAVFLVSLLLVSFGLMGIVGHVFPKTNLSSLISAKTFSSSVRNTVKRLSKLVTIDFIVLGLGIWGMYAAVRRGTYSMLTVLNPGRKGAYFKSVYEQLKLKRGPRIVVLGGDTGIAPLLEGLSHYTENITVVALPSEENIRNAVKALAGSNESMRKLLGYKFESSHLRSVDFGGLFLDALVEETGGTEKALKEATRVLSLSGKIVPALNGRGFETIRRGSAAKPKPGETNPDAVKAICEAEALILGPGSLYGAIIPALLIGGIKEAVVKSKCVKIYIANIMTEKNATEGYSLSEHIKKIADCAGSQFLHYCLVNNGPVQEEVLLRYKKHRSSPVKLDAEELDLLGVKVVLKKMAAVPGGVIRHDAHRLGRAVIKIISI
ncbi:MAG: 2-phospho-L-lactate transferase CofD family protein [Candidatus Firestonebacteria bacterium]